MARFWGDPYQERSLEQAANAYQQRLAALRNVVTPERAQALAVMAQTYPTMSAQLAQGVFGAGGEGSNSTLATLAMREERVREGEQQGGGGLWGWLQRNVGNPILGARNWVFDKLRAGTRGLMVAGEGLWEELLARPFRTAVGAISQGRTDFGNLWGEAGSSDLVWALQELASGRPVNLGSGFLPGSDDPRESDEYKELIAQGVDEEEAYEQVLGEMGRPVTDLAREQREQLRFRGQPISFGRVFAGTFVEPGSKPYYLMSGLVDVAARLALDPAAKTLKGLSYARKGSKALSLEPGAGDIGAFGRAARNFAAGMVPGLRKTIRAQSVDSWLMSSDGQRVCEVIANTTSDDAFTLIKDLLQRNNPTSVNRGLIAALVKETDPAKVSKLLRPHLGLSILEKPMKTTLWADMGMPSLSRGLGSMVGDDWGSLGGFGVAVKHRLADTPLGRLFEKMPGRHIALDDLDDGLNHLDEFLTSAEFSAAERSEHLMAWAGLRNGDYAGAFKVMKRVMRDLEEKLVDPIVEETVNAAGKLVRKEVGYRGIPRVLANRVTRMYKDTESMRQYMIDHVGTPGWFPGVETMDLGGQHVVMPTAQLIGEYLGRAIPLPDPNQLRRAFSKADQLHRQMIGVRRGLYRTAHGREGGLKGALTEATEELDALDRGAIETVMDFYMQKVWKPMVLLRLAWPVRVIGEEQLRMAGAGLDSLFSHPFSYISWQLGRGKTGVLQAARKAAGKTDDEIDEFLELGMSRQSREAMSHGSGGFVDDQGRVRIGRQLGARKGYAVYQRSGPKKPFLNAWSGHLSDLADDRLAAAVADDAGVAFSRFWDGDLKGLRGQLVKGSAKKTKVLSDPDGARLYIEGIRARIAESTGGTYKVINRRTKQIFRPGIDNWQDAEYVIQGGNAALRRAIATGDLGGVKVAGLSTQQEAKALQRALGQQYMFTGAAPDYVAGASWLDSQATGIYNRAVDIMFNSLMSVPTNKLSRAPAFNQFYWERIEGLAAGMNAKTLDKTIRAARAAGMDRGGLVKRLEAMRTSGRFGDVIDNIADADDLAKAYALHSTKKLLYDLSTRHRATQIMHNVFPFGEAWVEILTSWGRLMYRNPQIARRAQQVIAGARGSGIFYTDPVSNQEVFAYPGGGLLAKWMYGDDAPTSMRLQGMVQGLNLAAGSYMPGFGPMVQIPASWFLPDTPSADGVRRMLLPFGDVSAGSPGGIIDAALPSYMKKLLQALETPGANTEMGRLQGNTTIDVLRAMLVTGKWSLDTPESAMQAVKSASKKSTVLTLIRGFAQLILPTGPSVAFNVEDEQGRVWWFQTIAQEYYDRLQNQFQGDESAAMRWFIGAYGFNPMDVTTPKTQKVYRRPVTEAGDQWARDNADLFDQFKYPATAYFAQPDDPNDEFDYQAYARQLREGSRVPYTPEQWVVARNQTLGRVRYQRAKDRVGGRTDVYARQYLSEYRAWLTTQYPGYGLPNVGTVVTPDGKMMMEELDRWTEEPRLANSETGRALARYMAAVRTAQQASVAAGLSVDGYKTAEVMLATRRRLRTYAERLMVQYPDFAGLWRYVLEPQLADDRIGVPEETADTLLDRLTGGSI